MADPGTSPADWDRALAVVAHHLYLEHLVGDMASPDEFLRGAPTAAGERMGPPLAAAFEIIG